MNRLSRLTVIVFAGSSMLLPSNNFSFFLEVILTGPRGNCHSFVRTTSKASIYSLSSM